MTKNKTWILYVGLFVALVLLCTLDSYYSNKKYNKTIRELTDSVAFLTGEIDRTQENFNSYCDSIADIDTIKYENIVLKYKINRIKQYDSIVMRNSSQSKYFRGWVRRVIYD